MPCYDSRDSRSCGNCGEVSSLRRQVNELETMLCGIAGRAGAVDIRLVNDDPTLATWWMHHKAIDDRKAAVEAARKVRATIAKRAKKKLTKEEREALGIRD